MPRSEGHEYAEETVMCPTLNTVPAWWNRVMRVALVFMVLWASACTGPGHASSAPSAMPSEGGHAGSKHSGNGNGGNGM